MKNEPFVIERIYHALIDTVWQDITEQDKMKEWYFDLAEFKPEVGFTFQFLAGTNEKKYLHVCTITEVIFGKKLSHSWQYDGYKGISFVTFELFAEGDKTRLKLTHRGIETFPSSNPDFAQERFAEGWTYIIGTALKEFAEKSISH
jgi:uncharacterized protein YndB with AHSA1/START domain